MKKLLMIAALIIIVAVGYSTNAAETTVNGRMYAEWMLNTTSGADNANEISISRAYVTVKSKLSDFSSVRITTDIRSVENFDGYTIILKYGYWDWTPKFGENRVTIRFGLQPTLYIDNMNKLWNRRYMLKVASDEYKFLTSSDLGIGFIIGLGEKGKVGTFALQIFDGTSYTDVHDENNRKDFNGYVILSPFTTTNENLKRTQIHAQIYTGTQNDPIGEDEDASAYKRRLFSVGGVLGIQNTADIGFDLNFLNLGQGYDGLGEELDELKETAHSFFGTLYLSDLVEENSTLRTINLFGRYDILDPDTDADDDKEKLLVLGVECAPVKGLKASVNFRSVSFDDGSDDESSVNVNTLFKF